MDYTAFRNAVWDFRIPNRSFVETVVGARNMQLLEAMVKVYDKIKCLGSVFITLCSSGSPVC